MFIGKGEFSCYIPDKEKHLGKPRSAALLSFPVD
jgi:hypothetical protein